MADVCHFENLWAADIFRVIKRQRNKRKKTVVYLSQSAR